MRIPVVVCLVACAVGFAGVGEVRGDGPDAHTRQLLGEKLAGGGVVQGSTPHRLIHFTFDDGPDPRTTPRLLDRLDALGIKVTFFFSASRFLGHRRHAGAEDLAREVLRRGHTVGSHSVDHVRMAKLRGPALREQLDLSDRLFRKVFGAPTRIFRPPFGSRNSALDAMLAEDGMTTVMWNLGVADWVKRPPEHLLVTFERMLQRAEAEDGDRGGIVLLHDTHDWTIDAFDLFVAHLRDRNCQLLATGEELYDITDSLAPFIVHAKAGDPIPPAILDADTLLHRQARLRAAEQKRCAAVNHRASAPG